MITQELNRGWCIRPCTRGDWEIKTNVPCSVLHAMLEAKLAPDPFYRKNEYEVRELFDQNFCYTLRFVPQKEILEQQYAELVFYGLDTLADIRLNGEFLASVDNMHPHMASAVAGKLKKDENHLEITFRSSLRYIREKGQDPLIHYVAKGCIRGNNFFAKSALYVWLGLGPSAAGHRYLAPGGAVRFFRRAHRRHTREAGTLRGNGLSANGSASRATCQLGEYAVCCTLTSPSGDELCVRSVSAEGMATACFVLESPQLWWPNMYGEQPLYALNVELQDKDGQVQDGGISRSACES